MLRVTGETQRRASFASVESEPTTVYDLKSPYFHLQLEYITRTPQKFLNDRHCNRIDYKETVG